MTRQPYGWTVPGGAPIQGSQGFPTGMIYLAELLGSAIREAKTIYELAESIVYTSYAE